MISVMTSLLAFACGGAPDLSDFNKNDDGLGKKKGATEPGTIGGDQSTPTNSALDQCATQSSVAEARPVYLVFQYDKSGSMDDDGKWNACKAATKAFFNAPESAGVKASLTFFPSDGGNICSDSNYASPAVPMTALPSNSFANALDSRDPDGGTPTKYALTGALSYARTVQAGEGKDGNVAVVLVTDGIPANCGDNSISSVRSVAASAAATIPTYVIGVGDELGNLNDIAVGGGTKSAFIVSTGNPAETQAQLLGAIKAIKQQALACDYKIPAPTAGATLDRSKVNVQHVPTGGAPGTLTYNQACTNGTGWRYDDATNPTRILLCETSCNAVKARPGKVDIVYGCATQTGPVK